MPRAASAPRIPLHERVFCLPDTSSGACLWNLISLVSWSHTSEMWCPASVGRSTSQLVLDAPQEESAASDFLMSSAHARLAKALATGSLDIIKS